LSIAVPNGEDDAQFSSGIKTAFHSIGEIVTSWATYEDIGVVSTSGLVQTIKDRISPIIISASYNGGEGCDVCVDRLTINFSEPVEKVEGADPNMGAKNAFAYKLQSRGEFETSDFETPPRPENFTNIRWAGKRDNLPENDSVVVLTYTSYKNETDNSYTPAPSDTARLLSGHRPLLGRASGNPLEHAFKDMAGNFPNPNEIGRRIEGMGRFSVDKILITSVDPADSTRLIEAIKDRFRGPSGETIVNRFTKDKPIQLLPVPENWNGQYLKDSLGITYPSTLGPVFWSGAKATIAELDAKYGEKFSGKKIPRDQIFFVANSFYHTNLGNYVAKSGKLEVQCDDPIFKIDTYGIEANDCTQFDTGLYLGWNLKDNKGRWVGTGAYVQVYNFYLEVRGVDSSVDGVHGKYPSEGNQVEMYGVRRTAKKSK
jgi:hypothetical protein